MRCSLQLPKSNLILIGTEEPLLHLVNHKLEQLDHHAARACVFSLLGLSEDTVVSGMNKGYLEVYKVISDPEGATLR